MPTVGKHLLSLRMIRASLAVGIVLLVSCAGMNKAQRAELALQAAHEASISLSDAYTAWYKQKLATAVTMEDIQSLDRTDAKWQELVSAMRVAFSVAYAALHDDAGVKLEAINQALDDMRQFLSELPP